MIKLFSNHCPDCRRAKALLEENNIPFEFIDVSTEAGWDQFQEEFMTKYTNRTMPVAMKDGLAWPGLAEIAQGVKGGEF